MVNRCVAAGCSNTPSDKVSLHKFPKDVSWKREWEKQVQRTRAQWKATEHSYLCSEHFTEDCFEVDSAIAAQFGIKKRKALKPGAVPSIFPRPASVVGQSSAKGGSCKRPSTATSCESVEMTSKKKRGAVEKRERRQVWLT